MWRAWLDLYRKWLDLYGEMHFNLEE